MTRINNMIPPVANRKPTHPEKIATKPDMDFKELLEAAKGGLNVSLSKHAQTRMRSRNIMLDNGQVERLNLAVERARQKGIRDTLVLMDDKAFVINVKNTTLITAAKGEALKERVFTNIDGAVIV